MRHEPGSNASTDLKKKICMCLISVFRSLYLAVAVTLLEVCTARWQKYPYPLHKRPEQAARLIQI